MAAVSPFAGLRYDPARVGAMAAVVAPPYDVISPAEQDALYARSPFNAVRLVPGTLGKGLKEALVISAWVLLWRPVELLLYDGIPWRRERRVLRALHGAAIEIRNPG